MIQEFTQYRSMEKIIFRSEKISDFDLGFANGTKDEEYLSQLDQVLKGLINESFDLIFQAGVDGLDSDSLGLLSLTRAGLKKEISNFSI